MNTILIAAATATGAMVLSLGVALSAAALLRRGFPETSDPDVDRSAQLFEEDRQPVVEAFGPEIEEDERRRVSMIGR